MKATVDAAVAAADWAALRALLAAARILRDGGAADAGRRTAFDRDVAALARTGGPLVRDVFLPLIVATAEGPLTIAQTGQSLDGRVAAANGSASLINSDGALDHLHRLRALVDAVVVGASTVAIDDPQLTTRRVAGDSPVRVVIDPQQRLAPAHRVFGTDAPTVIICRRCPDTALPARAAGALAVTVAAAAGQPLSPRLIIAALRRRGLKSLLIEGGPTTLSLFLDAGLIDRLHLLIAPMIIGAGPASFSRSAVSSVGAAIRLDGAIYRLGDDMLFDARPRPPAS
ncbi:MAG: RibD family protein [Rhodospirillales bacterium]|nr:RibD family protein [Rhodospirillales bacterium]